MLSNLETSYFYILEWSEVVTDIREQYPLLPLTETLEIAERCGYCHPTDPKTQDPVVMTTDFLISVESGAKTELHARALNLSQSPDGSGNDTPKKHARSVELLTSRRTLEKLEIERLYWKARNVHWGIVTEKEIPATLVKNVSWLHPCRDLTFYPQFSTDLVNRIASVIGPRVLSERISSLSIITAECDEQLGLEAGVSLTAIRYLLANRLWITDMNTPIVPGQPLALQIGGASPLYGTACQYVA